MNLQINTFMYKLDIFLKGKTTHPEQRIFGVTGLIIKPYSRSNGGSTNDLNNSMSASVILIKIGN